MRKNQIFGGSLLATASIAILVSVMDVGAAGPATAPAPSVSEINAADLRTHISFLSSNEVGGRYTLSPGARVSARYLATQLEGMGFRGAAPAGSFFQAFEVIVAKMDPEASLLEISANGSTKQFEFGDFYSRDPQSGSTSGEVVFAGYGISAPRLGHDDYSGLDVRGKIVLLAPGTPKGVDASQVKREEQDEPAARAHGAAGVLVIPEARFRRLATPAGRERLRRWESVTVAALVSKERLPRMMIGPAASEPLLALVGMSIDQLYERSHEGAPLKPQPLAASARYKVAVEQRVESTQNVVALLEGADAKLKDEYVGFSAHYDHLKTGANGDIYPGADDDGSGTAAVLEIAESMSLRRPRRSIFVIFHVGEELGLLGAKYNTDVKPAVPLENLVANLNIDMIGRSRAQGETGRENEFLAGPNTVYVVGSDRISRQLHQISEQINAQSARLRFDYTYNDPNHPDRIYFRSDHWEYAKHGVPIIFYFTGVHADYHQPTDTIEKLDFSKMTRVTRLIYETGWQIANRPHRLQKD